jgi:ankyrin repeat protein
MKFVTAILAVIVCLMVAYYRPQSTYRSDPFETSTRTNQVDAVAKMLDQGIPVDGYNPDAPGARTPLECALERQCKDVALLLIERGASLNRKPALGDQPIIGQALSSDISVLKAMVKKGVDLNARVYGGTVLHAIVSSHSFFVGQPDEKPYIEKLEFLLEHFPKPNELNSMGQAPLHCAASTGNIVAIKVLIKHGANPNIQDREGNTPLMEAAKEGKAEIMHILLKAGARKELRNRKGQTALDLVGDIKSLLKSGGTR